MCKVVSFCSYYCLDLVLLPSSALLYLVETGFDCFCTLRWVVVALVCSFVCALTVTLLTVKRVVGGGHFVLRGELVIFSKTNTSYGFYFIVRVEIGFTSAPPFTKKIPFLAPRAVYLRRLDPFTLEQEADQIITVSNIFTQALLLFFNPKVFDPLANFESWCVKHLYMRWTPHGDSMAFSFLRVIVVPLCGEFHLVDRLWWCGVS